MGGQASKKSQAQISINHPKFHQTKIVTENNRTQLEINIGADEDSYQKWKKTSQDLKLNSEYLFLPIKKTFQSKGLCGSTGNLTLRYEDYRYLLSDEIAKRSQDKRSFSQPQIWLLLYVLSAAKRDTLLHTKKVGDIRPESVFINEEGYAKVACVYSWPNQPTNVQKAYQNELTYLAPQQIKQSEFSQVQLDPQSYSIGSTVLSAGILTNLSDQYNMKMHKFDYQLAEKRLNQWNRTHYSDILRATVSNLCEFNPQKRVSTQELVNWIQKYKGWILDKQNFVIDNAPQKIHNKVMQLRTKQNNIPQPFQSQPQSMIPQHMIHGLPIQGNNPGVFSYGGPKSSNQLSKFSYENSNITPTQSIYTPFPNHLKNLSNQQNMNKQKKN